MQPGAYSAETAANENKAEDEQACEQDAQDAANANIVEVDNADMTAGYFTPVQGQNYYYQDENGDYYYYTSQQPMVENERHDDTRDPAMREDFSKYYEHVNWEPYRHGWLIDIIVDTFLSISFKLYLTLLLYCSGVLIVLLGLNYTFSVLYVMYDPPYKSKQAMQVISYLSLFFYLTFAIVNTICVLIDMITNLWCQKRDDIRFWGMSHNCLSKQKPPYMIYLTIFLATVILPFFWGLIDASVSSKTVLYFLQCYASVATIVSVIMVALCYAWFLCRSLAYKRLAISKYKKQDEFSLREEAYKHHPEKMGKIHWYHAQTILEEFGIDKKTVQCDSIVYTLGCVPLFAMCAVRALSTRTGDPSVLWGAIGSLALICVYTTTWMSLLRRRNHWYIYMSIFLNLLFLVLGIVGAAATPKQSQAGIVVLLWVISQYMLTRRRKHSLTRKEICAMLEIPFDHEKAKKGQKKKIDSYLLCCHDVFLDYISCLESKVYFGYKHPSIRAAEQRRSIKRVALRCDQKVLLLWWIFVIFAVALVIGIGDTVRYYPEGNIALIADEAQTGTNPRAYACQVVYNENGSAPMHLYDLALLSALSFTYSKFGDKDFATWFSQWPKLQRAYPKKLPPTLNYATDGTAIRFSVYRDALTNFHFITLNSNSRGLAIFRDMNDWGESIVLRVAEAIAPFVSVWPESHKSAFVRRARFFKDGLPSSRALDRVKKAIEILIDKGLKEKILLVGEQFNGGYAKLLSAQYGIPFVAFNSPGTRYKLSLMVNGTQLSSVRGLWSHVDSIEDSDVRIYHPCNSSRSLSNCSLITTTIDHLRTLCGDPYKRVIANI